MTPRPIIAAVATLALAVGCSTSSGSEAADTGSDEPVEAPASGPGTLERYADYETVNYDDPSHWVCRPDIADDVCDGDLDATLVEADGTLTVEPFEPAADPPIDCFYVYPTISQDQSTYADWDASDDEEGYVTVNQAARLQSQCRLYAPVYRQITLSGLGSRLGGDDATAQEGDPYGDVADAFKTYMAEDNEGRGIVLIGHSQGTGMLNQLIAEEFDPNPDVRELLVGAYLAGGAVAVPEGELLGGDFQHVPLCAAEAETGCVDTWAAFRDSALPPENSFFGTTRGREGVAGCVSPAAPAGGPADLDSYFPANTGATILAPAEPDEDASAWVDPSAGEITTPFVRFTDLLTGECTSSDGFHYLAVTVNADPDDPRADDIGGDLTPEWGLHLVDVNLVMGDVVTQVAAQSEAYAG